MKYLSGPKTRKYKSGSNGGSWELVLVNYSMTYSMTLR